MGYTVSYPVLFEAGGDTTRDAFNKHIQEIIKMYGILNELSGADISEEELDALKTGEIDTSRLNGNIEMSRITGDLDISRVTGNIPGSRISGDISGANISHSRVTGLEAYVKSLIPSEDSGQNDGITEGQLGASGYAKFGNGLIVQWGTEEVPSADVMRGTVEFPKAFATLGYVVIAQVYLHPSVKLSYGASKSYFTYVIENAGGTSNVYKLSYIAIGE
ncbi:MAG: hypothetical protein IJG37_00495 [Synergistaceae bacterium]|nr:hypothetical protein [Synergistaceae bacterium]